MMGDKICGVFFVRFLTIMCYNAVQDCVRAGGSDSEKAKAAAQHLITIIIITLERQNMKYIKDIGSGSRVAGIFLCKYKQSAVTKNGKSYENITLMDKTGVLSGKIWEPNSPGIDDFEALDYIDVVGDVSTYNGALQISIKRARKAREGEYDPADYLPSSEKNIKEMWRELLGMMDSVKDKNLRALLKVCFVDDKEFAKRFCQASAAKSIHHGFMGGLLEHTLSVTKLCDYYSVSYPILNRDLLIAAAILHDVGKVQELSAFPANDYTDDGQLLGHITIGAEMIHDMAKKIPGFPAKLESELKHCILAHHGELEYGSPKKPALAEAMALNLADNTDARMESMKEFLNGSNVQGEEWLGYSKVFESNIRRTSEKW